MYLYGVKEVAGGHSEAEEEMIDFYSEIYLSSLSGQLGCQEPELMQEGLLELRWKGIYYQNKLNHIKTMEQVERNASGKLDDREYTRLRETEQIV